MKKQPVFDTRTILESISDGVFSVDLNWRVTSFNRAAEKITGVKEADALGAYCSEVFRCSLCGKQCALQETLKNDKAIINKECYFINEQGQKVPVSLSTAVLKDRSDAVIGGAETFRDLSEIVSLKKQLGKQHKSNLLISHSPSMNSVIAMVEAVADTSTTVLINGDTGTGKEIIAKALHQLSSRNKKPFIAINCAALPDNLLESTLFGHVKGAFTGAVENRSGYFSRAQSGTLFLDEIGDISAALQVRLLRVLQESEYEPVGSHKLLKSDARIITATNKDLLELVAQGKFRADLYYRLNVIRISLPGLTQRLEDIPFLVEQFIKRFNLLHHKSIQGISAEALLHLQKYHWPGNIRELENSIERACVLSQNSYIQLCCFPFVNNGQSNKSETVTVSHLDLSRELLEKQEIRQTLKNYPTKIAAAKALGIHKTTLFRKMKKYNIAFK